MRGEASTRAARVSRQLPMPGPDAARRLRRHPVRRQLLSSFAQDEFGSRTVHLQLSSRASLLCAPLVRSCGASDTPQCDGACSKGQVCSSIIYSDCQCAPGGTGCNATLPVAMCSIGDCPEGTRCANTGTGFCGCNSATLIPCGAAAAPTCYGACPGNQACIDMGGTCGCQ